MTYELSVRYEDGSMPKRSLDESPYAVFRATRIPVDHPGFARTTLSALDPQPECFETASK